jgi:hypothetical protein
MRPTPRDAGRPPPPAGAPDTALDFALVGDRQYVRATDVLRRMIALRPVPEITLRFVRPLTGAALLSQNRPAVPAVFVSAGEDEVFLSNAAAATPPLRIAASRNRLGGLHLRLGPLHLLAFAPGGGITDRIERCFDLVHPGLGNVFVVRNIRVFAGRPQRARLLWFRIVQDPPRQQARLTMRTVWGAVAEIGFRITPRPAGVQGTAPESPRSAGSAMSSSAMADADRPTP